jgi:hypothetical protein
MSDFPTGLDLKVMRPAKIYGAGGIPKPAVPGEGLIEFDGLSTEEKRAAIVGLIGELPSVSDVSFTRCVARAKRLHGFV